jgi:hypothetical protein
MRDAIAIRKWVALSKHDGGHGYEKKGAFNAETASVVIR